MRSTKDLLILLVAYRPLFVGANCSGLCSLLHKMENYKIISLNERYSIRSYIQKNMPTMMVEVTGAGKRESMYGWEPKEWMPRYEWLNEHIKIQRSWLKRLQPRFK